MRQITHAIGKVWDRICNHIDAAEHIDSLIRHKVLRPVGEKIEAYRESRRTIEHWSY